MARKKEYDREEVLVAALEVFWKNGYKATSMAHIVQATNLNTASLYKEFGDKEGLFREALEYYRDNILSHRLQILVDSPDLNGVRRFLKSVMTGAASPEYKGCLMMNHLAQKFNISDQAASLIDEFREHVESLLATALQNAQTSGDIPASKEPEKLASFIMSSVHGMVLYGRYQDRKSHITDLFEFIWQAVEK